MERSSSQPPAVLRVALAQIAPVLGDRDRNLALHLEQIAPPPGNRPI